MDRRHRGLPQHRHVLHDADHDADAIHRRDSVRPVGDPGHERLGPVHNAEHRHVRFRHHVLHGVGGQFQNPREAHPDGQRIQRYGEGGQGVEPDRGHQRHSERRHRTLGGRERPQGGGHRPGRQHDPNLHRERNARAGAVHRRDPVRPVGVEQHERLGLVHGAEHRHVRFRHHVLLGVGGQFQNPREAHPDGQRIQRHGESGQGVEPDRGHQRLGERRHRTLGGRERPQGRGHRPGRQHDPNLHREHNARAGAVHRCDPVRSVCVEQHERLGLVHGAEHRHVRRGHHDLHGVGGQFQNPREAHPDGQRIQRYGESGQGVEPDRGQQRHGERRHRTLGGLERHHGRGHRPGRHHDADLHRDGDAPRAADAVQRRGPVRPDGDKQHERLGLVHCAEHRHVRRGHHVLLGVCGQFRHPRETDPDGEQLQRNSEGGQGVEPDRGHQRSTERRHRTLGGRERPQGRSHRPGRHHDTDLHRDGNPRAGAADAVHRRDPVRTDGDEQHERRGLIHDAEHRHVRRGYHVLLRLGNQFQNPRETDPDSEQLQRHSEGGQGVEPDHGPQRHGERRHRTLGGRERPQGRGHRPGRHHDTDLHRDGNARAGATDAVHRRDPVRTDGNEQHEFRGLIHDAEHRHLRRGHRVLLGLGDQFRHPRETDPDSEPLQRHGESGQARDHAGHGHQRHGEFGDRAQRGVEHARGTGDGRGHNNDQELHGHRHAADDGDRSGSGGAEPVAGRSRAHAAERRGRGHRRAHRGLG